MDCIKISKEKLVEYCGIKVSCLHWFSVQSCTHIDDNWPFMKVQFAFGNDLKIWGEIAVLSLLPAPFPWFLQTV